MHASKSHRERQNECVRQNERVMGERHTGKSERQKEKRDTDTEMQREGQRRREKGQRDRDTQRDRKSDSERERGKEGEREEKNMLGTYYATKCSNAAWTKTPKVSPCLPFISSNYTRHSIKQGHPQHTIKPHFHSVSIVVFHTALRAMGSSIAS